MKVIAFFADEPEKISDSRERCYPIRESESDSSNYKNMGTSKKVDPEKKIRLREAGKINQKK